MPTTELFIALINGIGLMALVAMLYGAIERLPMARRFRSLLQGITFGLGALLAMMSPVVVVPGVLADARAIFVALAGAFVGPIAAAIALLVAGAYRIWLGGIGMPAGLGTLAISFTAGLVWRYAWLKRRPVTPLGLLALGLAVSTHGLIVIFVPIAGHNVTLALVGLCLAATSLFATQVLGAMMARENRLIAREKSLINDAYTDPLTGLPNRRALENAETAVLANSAGRGFVVLMIDIDHFKAINDRFGHDSGDAALCILSDLLRGATRMGDVLVRSGGEEFVVILPNTRSDEGRAIAERVLERVRERRIVLPAADFAMTVSIGLAHARQSALAEAIARADVALYRAKHEGRDRMVAEVEALVRPAASPIRVPAQPAALRPAAAHRAP